jgi:osmotically-inducible protein OsmY
MGPRDVTAFLALVFCLLCVIDGASARQSQRDQETQAAIEKDFMKEKIQGVNMEVRGGTAILSGRPRNVFVKNRALEIALAHVEEVESEMEIATAESDKQLGEEVIKAIRRYSRIGVFDDIGAYVKEGKVGLGGWVTEPYKSNEIEKRMAKILGIQEFQNNIEVLPTSQTDRHLRAVLARRLYSDSLFEDYASMVQPPIRIIVKNSRVILSGVVRGQLEKTRALSIIRGTHGVLTVEDRLRIGGRSHKSESDSRTCQAGWLPLHRGSDRGTNRTRVSPCGFFS